MGKLQYMFSGFMIDGLYEYVVPSPDPMVEYKQQDKEVNVL